MGPNEDRAVVFPCALASPVAHPGMNAQRGQVDHEQAEGGEDHADSAGVGVAGDEDHGEDQGVAALLHYRTISADSGQV